MDDSSLTAGVQVADLKGREEPLRIRLLGGFGISIGPCEIGADGWRLRKAASLIKLLALSPECRMHRERIVDTLWPDLGIRRATNNLHQALYVARRALGAEASGSYLSLVDAELVLCRYAVPWVDVEAFRTAVTNARSERTVDAYRRAMDFYVGDLLPGDRYEEWAEQPRRELRELYLDLHVELAGLHEGRDEHGDGIDVLERAASEEPLREEVHASLMRLYAVSGRRRRALAQYERLEKALRYELGTQPGQGVEHLRKEISEGAPGAQGSTDELQSSNVGQRGNAQHSNNLPHPTTSFVGREHEASEVKRLLATSRLLTLVGVGGAGKTRLGLEVARDGAEHFPDGTWLVELSRVSQPVLVSRAIADVLGVREHGEHQTDDILAAALQDKSLLLLLDNCEHVIAEAARVAERLLGRCPNLTILATSREVLGIGGEVCWDVEPLSLPDPELLDRVTAIEDLDGSGSVRLFVDRARQRVPDLTLTPRDARAVAEICQRLDGIPLAVELAAARVGTLSMAQLARKLDDPLKILSTGPRTVEPRQRTLRGALDWSYRLLEGPEQELLRRLSVFAGEWTLESAEAVASGGDIEEGEVLGLLADLVDKSLVTVGAAERYRLLEPVRLYAAERLGYEGEADEVRWRHALWCLDLAERASPGLEGPEQALWLDVLEAEHANIRDVLGWCLSDEEDGDRTEIGLRMASVLWPFWDIHGYTVEGSGWLEKAISVAGAKATPALAKTLQGAGWISLLQGEYGSATKRLQRSRTLHLQLEDRQGAVNALTNLGFVALLGMRADLRAEDLMAQLDELRTGLEEPPIVGNLLMFQGMHLGASGDGPRGEALHKESLEIFQETGDARGEGMCLTSLALMELNRNNHDRATSLLRDVLRISGGLEKKLCISYALFGLACLAATSGRLERAARLWGASERVREAAGLAIAPMFSVATGYDDLAAGSRVRLGRYAFDLEWAEGKRITSEEAIRYALSEEPATPQKPLTHREREVAKLVAQGMSNRRISKVLVISNRTVETHVRNILKKFNSRSRADISA